MDYELLGRRIREERLALGLTIEQLAERVNKSANYVGQIERNDGKPSLETVVDIANALGTTVDSLLRDSLAVTRADAAAREAGVLMSAMDDTGRQFALDMMKRYLYYYGAEQRNAENL